jgi:DNA gyrase subunit B
MSNDANNADPNPNPVQPDNGKSQDAPARGPAAGGQGASPDLPQYGRIEGDYGAKDLEHLSDLEHVRERFGMYIGDNGMRGLHHLVFEVVDNSIDEAMAGHARQVSVTINVDGSVTVEDDGRGIPVEEHPDLGFSTLQGVMTVLKFGG